VFYIVSEKLMIWMYMCQQKIKMMIYGTAFIRN